MTKKDVQFSVEVYNSLEELSATDAALLKAARDVTANAYAPYSKFLVGAVAQLVNGKIVSGTNQENASYPVGICAERVLLSSVASQYQNAAIDTIAISYNNTNGESDHPISPCGICRQSLMEYQSRVQQPIRLILGGMKGKVIIIDDASFLLPFNFDGKDIL